MNLIAGKVSAGHIDGPFSIAEAQYIYGGHFCTCLLGLVDKPGSVDLHMIHHFLKEDQFGHSTNGWLDSDDFYHISNCGLCESPFHARIFFPIGNFVFTCT